MNLHIAVPLAVIVHIHPTIVEEYPFSARGLSGCGPGTCYLALVGRRSIDVLWLETKRKVSAPVSGGGGAPLGFRDLGP